MPDKTIAVLKPLAQRKAELWEGVVRFMESNNKTTFEIGLSDAKEIAIILRSVTDGREQAAQAQVQASCEDGVEARQISSPAAHEDRWPNGIDPQQAGKADESSGRAGSDGLAGLPDDKYIERALELTGGSSTVEDVKRSPATFARRAILAHARTLQERDARIKEAEDVAWMEALQLARGTNADMCKSAAEAYRLICGELNDARNNRNLRTLMGRVKALQEQDAQGEPGLYSRYHRMLLDLLAVIHRDGGHKTEEIGLNLAWRQAMQLSSERIAAQEHEAQQPQADWLTEAREALEWYAEQTRLARLIHSGGDEGRHALAADGGKRARAALEKLREAGHG